MSIEHRISQLEQTQRNSGNTGEMTQELFEAILLPVAMDKIYQDLVRGSRTAVAIENRNRFRESATARRNKVLIAHYGPRIIERIQGHCDAVAARLNA